MPTKVPMKVHKRGVSARTTNAFIVSGKVRTVTLVADLWPNVPVNSPMAFCRRSGKGLLMYLPRHNEHDG
ncbi:Uncharacterised protein [Klebsiella pneumoniae]|uniref:Uncharacterized protein n=1 Tax=Klebsiella pneumoniae TaxID=573 RepID=A0A4P0Y6E4_KLEPN|nr:Uncharacterised protein [Klebsiella pneumoniae]